MPESKINLQATIILLLVGSYVLIAEPIRNLGKYSFAVVVMYRLNQGPIRMASAIGGLLVLLCYTIASDGWLRKAYRANVCYTLYLG